MTDHSAEEGYYLLCTCWHCTVAKFFERGKHLANCGRRNGSACRGHNLTFCHCDCGRRK